MPRKKSDLTDLIKKHKTLAKAADRKLRNLEALSKEPGYENVLKWSYKNAMRAIKYWGGEKARRFDIKPPKRKDQILSKIRDIEKFLASPSSGKAGIKAIYKKRKVTYKKVYGLDLKLEDMGDFFNSEEFMRAKSLEDGYTSKTYMRAIGQIQANERKILNAINKNMEINLDIEDDLVDEAVNHLLEKYGKDVVNLY